MSNPTSTKNQFVGSLADEYAMLKQICPAAAEMSRRVGEFVATLSAPQPGQWLDVLEIGTGTGITTLHLLGARSDMEITGLDLSAEMLEQARRNLADAIDNGRLALLEQDALSHLAGADSESFDLIASGYALHNFQDVYRTRVLKEIFRVLKPGGVFVNGDRYALDDPEAHLRGIQAEVRDWFRVLRDLDRLDILEEWVVHLYSDESPHHVMRLGPALATMESIGFSAVTVHYRNGGNALVSGSKARP